MPKFPSLSFLLVSISCVNGSLSDKNTFGNMSYFIQVSHAYYTRYFESQSKHKVTHFIRFKIELFVNLNLTNLFLSL